MSWDWLRWDSGRASFGGLLWTTSEPWPLIGWAHCTRHRVLPWQHLNRVPPHRLRPPGLREDDIRATGPTLHHIALFVQHTLGFFGQIWSWYNQHQHVGEIPSKDGGAATSVLKWCILCRVIVALMLVNYTQSHLRTEMLWLKSTQQFTYLCIICPPSSYPWQIYFPLLSVILI